MASKYLITGGAGFIGSHIAEQLVRKGASVRILDNLSTGRLENIRAFAGKIEFVEADIRDAAAAGRAAEGVDYIIHQAALASVERSVQDPVATNEVNVQGTLNVLEAARKASVKKFVYASSSSVYGDAAELPKIETMIPRPMSPYAVSKLAAEWYCRVYSDVFKLPTVSLRYFNVFGPRQDPNSDYAAVIPIFVASLLRSEQPRIFGDGEQSRDFTYVDNVVAANVLACERDGSGGRVYNVACGQRFTLNWLFERLKTEVGADVVPTYGPPRRGDVKHSQASIAAIQKDLGYRTTVQVEQGLRDTVQWYKQQRGEAIRRE